MVLSIYENEPVFFAVFFTLGGFFVIGSILISFILIIQHWIHYNKPVHQKYIVRIILISPIYACNSFLSLYFKRQYWSVFFDVFRDVYESYVLYCFFKLLICFLGGEEALKELLSKKDSQPLTWPLGYFKFKPTKSFYRLSLTLILQYTILKPVGAIIAAILFYNSKYIDGDFSPNQGYLYITIVNNISVLIALYFLVMFYEVFKLELTPHQPVLKFLVIKSVIFFLFWQTVIIYILIWFDALPKSEVYSSEMIGYFISDFLVCIEMFLTSIAMGFAFSYYDYIIDGGYSDEKLVDGNGADYGRNRGSSGKILKSFKNMKYNFKRYKHNIGDGLSDIHNQKDIILDTIKVVKLSPNNNNNNNINIGDINNNINNSIINNNNNNNNNNNDEEYFNFVDLNSSEKDKQQKKFPKYFKIQPDQQQQQTSFIHFDEISTINNNNINNNSNNQFENIDINNNNSISNRNDNNGDDGVILFTI